MAGSNVMRPSLGLLLRPRASVDAIGLTGASIRAAQFSTTAPQHRRKTKDANKKRGVSSLYRSGPREHLSMSNVPLPKPRSFEQKLDVDAEHGLWGFFPDVGKSLYTPAQTEEHGRGWTVEELRKKSWEDLHALWWVCCRERNMLSTSKAELKRGKYGFGEQEFELRDAEVKKTMRAIKHALTERYYTWEDAVQVARTDPEINLDAADGQVYQPSQYEDEFVEEESWDEVEPVPEPTRADGQPTREAPR